MKLHPIAVIVVLLLAGCTAQPSKVPGIYTKDDVQKVTEFETVEPRLYRADGQEVLEHGWLAADHMASFTHQPTPGVGGEPTLGAPPSGAILVTVGQSVKRTTDFGKTWQEVHRLTGPNYPTTQPTMAGLDPNLWLDAKTKRIFVSHIHQTHHTPVLAELLCVYLAYSDDDGKTWSDQRLPMGFAVAPGAFSCLVPGLDHQKIITAKPGPKTDPLWIPATSDYPNVLYMCYQRYPDHLVGAAYYVGMHQTPTGGTWCEMSFDSGRSYTYAVHAHKYDPGCPAGLTGHPAPYPDGTVVVPLGGFMGCRRPPTVLVSEDSGKTWTARVLPNASIRQVELNPDITVTSDGVAYMTFRGDDEVLYLVRSSDKFQTWEGPWRIPPPDQTMNVFSAITSGDDGKIAILYLGTRDAQPRYATPSNATGGTMWHAFVTMSLDATSPNPTFLTRQVNALQDPVQVGCVWLNGGPGGPKGCRNLLDFIDITLDPSGRVVGTITDGCTHRQVCPTDTDAVRFQSRDRQVFLVVQESGLGLRGAEPLPRLGLENPLPFQHQDAKPPGP